MGAIEAVKFLSEDHGDSEPLKGFLKTFSEDEPYSSILQRNKKDLDEVLEMFDWTDDGDKWLEEYKKKKGQDVTKLVRYRRRVCFCACGWREFNEDFGRGDVSCLRDIRTPLVTSRSPLKAMKDDFDEQGS